MWWVPHQWNISEDDGCHFQAGCIKFAQFFALLCSWKLVLKMAGPQDGRNLHLGNLCVQEINLYCVKALRWGSSSSVTASNMTLTSSFISHNLALNTHFPALVFCLKYVLWSPSFTCPSDAWSLTFPILCDRFSLQVCLAFECKDSFSFIVSLFQYFPKLSSRCPRHQV